MAKITLEMPDEVIPRVINAFAESYDWNPRKGNKADFAKKMMINIIRGVVISHEEQIGRKSGGKVARDKAESEIIIT